jgi:serine protease
MRDQLFAQRLIGAALAACALLLGGAPGLRDGAGIAPAAAQPRSASQAAYVPHEVLVGYRSGPTAARMTTDLELRMGARASGPPPAPHSVLLRLPTSESVSAAIAKLRRQPGVAYAEPDYIAQATGSWYPNDPGRAHRPDGWEQMQWNFLPLVGVNAPEAWANLRADRRPGGRGVVVAILDTGVAYRNWHKFRKSPDFGGTRFVDPYDFIANNRYPLDRNGHGTFVAGIVAEATNNGHSLTGLAYGATIMPIRVLDSGGLGDEATIARGIRYAVKHGAQVINLSLEFLPNEVTSASDIPELVSAINYAHAHGVTIVGASGNDQSRVVAYPARAHNVISVGATTRDLCLADYSNGGAGLDLVAPGGGDDATMPSDPFCHPDRNLPSVYQLTLLDPPHWRMFGYPNYYIGTSMSAPEVAATAALVIASGVIGPNPTPDQILQHLEQTAVQLGPTKPNPQFGYGRVDTGTATAAAPPPPPPTTTTTTTTTTSATPSSPATG